MLKVFIIMEYFFYRFNNGTLLTAQNTCYIFKSLVSG